MLQKCSHLIELYIRRSKQFWWRSEIVHNGYRKDLQANQLLKIFLSLWVSWSTNESHNSVLIFISEFPPVRTQLGNISRACAFQAITKCGEFLIDQIQIAYLDLYFLTQHIASICIILHTINIWSLISRGILSIIDLQLVQRLAHATRMLKHILSFTTLTALIITGIALVVTADGGEFVDRICF